MEQVEATLEEAQDFRDQFFVQLVNKGVYYDTLGNNMGDMANSVWEEEPD